MNSGRFANSPRQQQLLQPPAVAASLPASQRRSGRLRLVRPAAAAAAAVAAAAATAEPSGPGGSRAQAPQGMAEMSARAANGQLQSAHKQHTGTAGISIGSGEARISSSCPPRSLTTPPQLGSISHSPFPAANDASIGQATSATRDSMTDNSTIAKSSSDSMFTKVPESAATSRGDFGAARTPLHSGSIISSGDDGLPRQFAQHSSCSEPEQESLAGDSVNKNNNKPQTSKATRAGDSKRQRQQSATGAIVPSTAAQARKTDSLQSTPTMEYYSPAASLEDSATETDAVNSTAMLDGGGADRWTSRHNNVAEDSNDTQYAGSMATADGEHHAGTMLDGNADSNQRRMAADGGRAGQTASPPVLSSLQLDSEYPETLRQSRSMPASATATRFPSSEERMSDIDYVELLDSYYDYLPIDESSTHSMAAGDSRHSQRLSHKPGSQQHKDRINSWRGSRGLQSSNSANMLSPGVAAGRGATSSYYGKAESDNSYSQTLENALFYSHAIQQINDGEEDETLAIEGPSAVTVPQERPDKQTLRQRRGCNVVASREVFASAIAGPTVSTFIPIPSTQKELVSGAPVRELPPMLPIPTQHAGGPVGSRSAPVSRGPSRSVNSSIGDNSSVGVSSTRVGFTSEPLPPVQPRLDHAPDSPTDGLTASISQHSDNSRQQEGIVQAPAEDEEKEEEADENGVKQRSSWRSSRISDAFAQLSARKQGSRRSSMAEPRVSAEISANPRRASVHSNVHSAQTQARRLSMTSQFSSVTHGTKRTAPGPVQQNQGHHVHIPPSHQDRQHQQHSTTQQSRQIATRLLMRAGLSRIALRVAGKVPMSDNSDALASNLFDAEGSGAQMDLDPNGLHQLKAERRKQVKHVNADGFMEFEGDDGRESEYTQQYNAWRARRPSRGTQLRHQRSLPHGLGDSRESAEAKWGALLRTLDASTMRGSRKIKQLVQAGLPMRLRSQIYHLLSGAPRLEKPHHYAALLAMGDLPIYDVIERDVPRCYPDHVMFADADSAGQRQLRRILRAYAHHNAKVGYCQGMGRLVGLFLIVGMSEERAFWALAATISNYIPRYYEPDLGGLRIHTAVFESLLRERCPQLYEHLAAQGCDALMYATPWFMTIFTLSLPWQSALRVWDWFLYRGPKALFRIALAIMDLASDYLLDACPTITEQLGFLLHIPPSLVDADALISAAINVKVSERHIERLTRSATAAVTTPKH